MSQTTTKRWWESSGFLLSSVMIFGSMYGLNEQLAQSAVTATTGLVGAGAGIWHFFKTSKFRGFADWIKDSNTWVYLSTAVGAFLPNAGALFPSLKGLTDAIISKNFGAIMSAAVGIGVVIWNVFVKKK